MSLRDAEQRLVEAFTSYLDALQEEIGRPTEADWAAVDQAVEKIKTAE